MPHRKTAVEERSVLGTHEVARILSVDAGTVIRWVDSGDLQGFRTPGGHRRVSRQELLRFALEHNWVLS